MSNNFLISVIIPVYNVESRFSNALSNCLCSLQNQTYKNLEIILVDDGSTDDSKTICDQFAESDNRFRVFHTENQGQSSARNYGINLAQGDFIFFSDADDLIHPQCLEMMANILSKYPNCDIVRGKVQLEENPFQYINSPLYDIKDNDSIIVALLRGQLLPTVWNQLIRKEVFKDIQFRITTFEDFDFDLRMYLKVKNIITLNNITYTWIQRDLSDSHKNKIKRYYGKLESMEYLFFNDIKQFHPKYTALFLWKLYNYYFSGIMNDLDEMTDEYKQNVCHKFMSIYAATKKDFMDSNAPTLKKVILPLYIRFPKSKKFIDYLISKMKIIK